MNLAKAVDVSAFRCTVAAIIVALAFSSGAHASSGPSPGAADGASPARLTRATKHSRKTRLRRAGPHGRRSTLKRRSSHANRPSNHHRLAAHRRAATKARGKRSQQRRGIEFRRGRKTRNIRLVIFDLDGTLADTREGIAANFKVGFDAIGADIPMQSLLELVDGSPLEQTYWAVRPKGNKAELQHFLDAFLANQKRTGPYGTPYPEIDRVLRRLQRRGDMKLAVATARPSENAKRLLSAMGLAHHFDFITGTDGTSIPHKPAPDILLHVASKLGVHPDQTLFIGDTTTDVQAGKAAGMSTVAVTYGMHRGSLLRAERPHAEAPSARALMGLLGLRGAGQAPQSSAAGRLTR